MKCWGEWWGGHSYSKPEREDREPFESIADAKEVFESRVGGFDPVKCLRTPCVEGSEMQLFDAEDADDVWGVIFEGPRGGIRVERA